MIDFSTTYELTGCSEQAFLSKGSKKLRIDGFRVARGEATLPREAAFVCEDGPCHADVVGTGFPSLYLISSALAGALKADGVTGWRSTPVRFERSVHGTPAAGAYHALSITGRCGPILYERSEIIEKRRGRDVTKFWKGSYFEPSTWDGSDMFTPVDVGTVFIVSRVRELLRLFDLDGVTPMPLSAVERMILPMLLKK